MHDRLVEVNAFSSLQVPIQHDEVQRLAREFGGAQVLALPLHTCERAGSDTLQLLSTDMQQI